MTVANGMPRQYHYEANQGDVPDFYAGIYAEHDVGAVKSIISLVKQVSIAVLRGFFSEDTKPVQACYVRRFHVNQDTGQREEDALFEVTFSDASLDECLIDMLEPIRMPLRNGDDDE